MSDVFKNIKRIKLLGKLFLGFSNNKIIFKDFDKSNEHVTMLFKPNGILDTHRTKEGSEKEYESLGIFDLGKTVQKIVSDPMILVNGLTEFADYKIANFKTQEELASIVKREKKDIIIPVESLGEFFPFKDTILWKDAKDKIKDNALVLNKDGIPVGYLLKIQEKIVLISVNIMENPFVSKLLSMMINPEKFEPEKQHDTQGKD